MSATEMAEAQPAGGLFLDYAPPPDVYDEVLGADGRVRDSWQPFAQVLNGLGPAGLLHRGDQVKRLLRENGVTYSTQGAPQGPDRPWELDPIPLLFSSAQWQTLARAVEQRALLLNLILQDVYGPQNLLKAGIFPPSLVYGNPSWLATAKGLAPLGSPFLQLYAGHLARQPDGRWVVLADRTQGPTGAGYAVENRLVIARTLPQDFQSLHVERLASFYIALRDTLHSMARTHRDNPRVVLLSPGPRSPTYFEDGYLARYLGYTLVEGGDLTVRGDQVFLKTLGGLLPVDVILRRIPDEDCDPLELRADSPLSTPGLLQAVRSGQVVVANGIGSGFLESPALLAFLPAACRILLNQDLQLPSVATWWCGRPADLSYVEAHWEELVVRPAFVYKAAPPISVRLLSPDERAGLWERICRRPDRYVAQEEVRRSTAPVWTGQQLQPWHVGLRVFATSTSGGFNILPGGLSRVSSPSAPLGNSASAGQGSKDVWVLADAPVSQVTLLHTSATVLELRRTGNDLPSRICDHLFWLGRLTERAEGLIRHLRSCMVRLTNDWEPAGLEELEVLVAALSGEDELAAERRAQTKSLHTLRDSLWRSLFDEAHPNGVAATLLALRRTASVVRDRLSIDGWRIVNQLDLSTLFPWSKETARLGDVLLLLNHILMLLSAFSGVGAESMTRGPGWRFLDMGRRIERAVQMLRLLRNTLVLPRGELIPLLEALLEIGDSSLTYRYRYLASLQLAPVLDLLLLDDTNPRSVAYQISLLREHVERLPHEPTVFEAPPDAKLIAQSERRLHQADVESLTAIEAGEGRQQLGVWLKQIYTPLLALSDTITQHFLTHTGPARQLGVMARE
ncbi:MAG TPA: circularly permuted type 2 ATP-grasp protein [Pirellulales bacterium]|jgi:uncharacterized circularly permuted ATP-grasp superfamily protein/uncharacterized alpha-E superfamily protein|nr:circularly permuted type 2 ATP-grasp protein [Pirellulales bacterium]